MLVKDYNVLPCPVTFKIVDDCSRTVKVQEKDSPIKMKKAL